MKFKNGTIKLVITLIILAVVGVGVYFSFPALLRLVGYVINLFLPFILGYIFSVLVNPLADFLQKRLKIPRGMSAVLVIVLIVGVLGSFVTFVVWKIVDEVRTLYTQFPVIYVNILDGIQNMKEGFSGIYTNLPDNIQGALDAVGTGISDKVAAFINTKSSPVMNYAGTFAKALPSVLIGIIVFILSSFFMVSDSGKVSKFVHGLFSEKARERLHLVRMEIKLYLGGYFKAQAVIMSIVFVILFTGLTILGVEYALLIALGIAFLDALPFFGSGAALWPWSLISFINGDIKMGFGAIIIYVVIILTRQFIEPKIVSSNIGMNSILTLMSMYIGYKTFSIGGMILGPITLMLLISFYKAGVFDGPIRLIKQIGRIIGTECRVLADKVRAVWDTDEK